MYSKAQFLMITLNLLFYFLFVNGCAGGNPSSPTHKPPINGGGGNGGSNNGGGNKGGDNNGGGNNGGGNNGGGNNGGGNNGGGNNGGGNNGGGNNGGGNNGGGNNGGGNNGGGNNGGGNNGGGGNNNNDRCPRDALKLGVCADILGLINVVIGSPPTLPCCSLLEGLVDLEAAICLCTAIRANILGINLNIPITLTLLLNVCGRTPPPGFVC